MYTTIDTYFSIYMNVCCAGKCFGRIQSHHQEVQPYVYNNWYLFFYLYDCLLCWYMFRAYPVPSSGSTTICIQQLVLIFLFI